MSCSKEETLEKVTQTSNLSRKSGPLTLAREHNEILDFLDQFNYYINDDSYSYPSLTLSDAEWISEAALNYSNIIPDLSSVDPFGYVHEDADTLSFSISNYQGDDIVDPADLFDLFERIVSSYSSIDDKAPCSDLKILFSGGGSIRKILVRYASTVPHMNLPTPISYADEHRAIGLSSNIKSNYYQGGTSPCPITGWLIHIHAWEILELNLRATKSLLTYPNTGTSGYFTSVTYEKYGDKPFDNTSYLGPNQQDYSLDILGADPDHVNSNSISTGHWGQCVSKSQIQGFEANMADLLDDHTTAPNSHVLSLTVSPKESYTGAGVTPEKNNWYHHVFSFTTGILVP